MVCLPMNSRLFFLGVLVLLPACHGAGGPNTVMAKLGANGFEELVEVYKYRATEGKPAPTKLTDLDENEAALPNCYPNLQNGEYVLFWGVGLAAGSDAVLGYEKGVPQSGGLVLLQNG